MAKPSITGTKILSKEKTTLEQISYETEGSDGQVQQQTREVFSHGNAVACLLYNKESGTILLTRQFRIATFVNGNASGMLLEAAAGLLERDEDPADAMKRELTEETGYEVSDLQQVCAGYSSPGAYTEFLTLFIAAYTRKDKVAEGGGLKEEGEDISLQEMLFHDALKQIETGAIKDIKTILLLQYAAWKGLL